MLLEVFSFCPRFFWDLIHGFEPEMQTPLAFWLLVYLVPFSMHVHMGQV